MKTINKITLSLAVATTVLLTGCNDSASVKKPEVTKKEVVKPTISEESLGLRKVDLYSEDSVKPEKTMYGKSQPMSGYKITRAFQDAPPMIPHDTTGMLPITIKDNQCIGCHMPDVASSMGATPIPVSHFTNFRPHHKFDGKKFEKAIDNMKNDITIKKTNKLQGARFNCTQCHAPQSTEKPLVENTFKPEYTSKDGMSKSSWNGEMMTYGLDTLGKDSYVEEKDLNMPSPAGHLEGGH